MTSEEIKEIRRDLELTQEELAAILGVTKTSVARYEMQGGGSKPQGDIERKLVQLHAFISDPIQKEEVKKIRNDGGVASIAGILAIGAATFPVSATVVRGITLKAILTSPAALFLGGILAVGGAAAIVAASRASTEKKNKKQGGSE